MRNNISHSGVIESIEDGCIHVRIIQTSACAACKVAGYCNAAESKEKLIDIYSADTKAYSIGQSVTVMASRQVAANALLLGFGIPFIILVGVLVVVLMLTHNEAWAALGGLIALVPYYGVLYLMRERLRDKLSFWIE
ncbi:MAG: SoxR reducing system RseC family protein [Prevotella sp.]|nr:SoxR reducing system RseC family protein [Prevotella sp.]